MRAALLLLLLGGCAAVAPATPPLSYPPSAAERIVRIAIEEWRDWGAPVQQAFDAPPEGSPESDPRNFPRVLAYWRAVPQDYGAIADNRARYRAVLAGAREAIWNEPQWSAAFISWVMSSAGVDAREFPPNATHALYLDALIADAAAYPDQAPFVPNAPEEYAPRLGDLVCRDRSAAPLRRWQDRLHETGAIRPMHCDIVVGVDARDRVVRAVGGNVADAVTMVLFATDAEGRLLPAPPGHAPVVVIMRNRLGRLPPWGNE